MNAPITQRGSLLQQALHQTIASLEAASLEADGKTAVEREYVIYAKIVDFDQLSKASDVEHQEQWELRPSDDNPSPYRGSVRVRKCWRENTVPTYVLTIKTFQKEGDGKDEVEVDVTKDVFEQLRRLCTGGMTKSRYFFPIEHEGQNLIWEVDVYRYGEDRLVKWVKLDLEVGAKLEALPAFPVELEEVFDTQPEDRSEEQTGFVQGLMDKFFVRSNPFATDATSAE